MKRLRRGAIVLCLLLALASVSIRLPRNFEAVDAAAGAPLHPAYVAYSYMGSRFNPAHASTYRAGPLTLARSDSSGRIAVPAAFHVHKPFPLESHPSLHVEFVYVPRLHNALARMDEHDRAAVADLTDQPEQWQGSLRNIASMISRLTSRTSDETPLTELPSASAALIRELIAHFRQEYEAFLARYRDTPRPKPQMPEHIRLSSPDEQRRWQETNEAHLAQEPLWGMLVTRVFERQVKVFNQRERELR